MQRSELIVPNTLNWLMYTYNKFLVMKQKYKDKCYSFELYDYKDSGYDIVMNHHGFHIYGTGVDSRDDNFIFRIESADQNSEWLWMMQSMITSHEFLYCAGKEFVNEFGDHKNVDKRETILYNFDEVEELGENLTEEWFFQQMTVQNIIPYEDFLKEFELAKTLYNSNIKQWDIIHINYLRDFDISLLEGFRII